MQAPSAPLLGGTIPFMGVHSQREKEEREDANEEEPTVAATFLQPDLDEEVTAGGGMELRQRRVYVHTLEGQVVPVDISEGEKVEDLKMRLDDHDPFLSANAPAFGDRHLYDQDGEELREGRRVLSYSIGESSSIRLLLARYVYVRISAPYPYPGFTRMGRWLSLICADFVFLCLQFYRRDGCLLIPTPPKVSDVC